MVNLVIRKSYNPAKPTSKSLWKESKLNGRIFQPEADLPLAERRENSINYKIMAESQIFSFRKLIRGISERSRLPTIVQIDREEHCL